MTCAEFERALPEFEGRHDLEEIEQEEHLRTCPSCFMLVTELKAISEYARELQSSEEPSARVWNSIEIALRLEGIIRDPHAEPVRRGLPRWKPIWLAPIAVLLLVTSGVLVREREKAQAPLANNRGPHVTTPAQRNPIDDEQMNRLLAKATPAVRAAYVSDIDAVNDYVRDAQASAQQNPNDEVAQEYLRGAYEQQSMVYEMALNRSPQ